MDPIENPRDKSFDAHFNYLLKVVNEWVEMVNQSPVMGRGEDTLAWIEAHKGLLWLYEDALTNVSPESEQDANFGLFNFYGVGHAIAQVVSQFRWRPDYPFKDYQRERPPRRQKETPTEGEAQ